MQLRRSIVLRRTGTSGLLRALGVVMCSVGALVPSEPSATTPSDQPSALTVVAFGTSLTARGGWQDALRMRLEACLGRRVEIVTVAQVGATSEWALAHAAEVVDRHPDVVLVEFAVNDASLTRWLSLARSRSNMEQVLSRLRKGKPAPRVFILAMNPVRGLRGWLRPRLSAFTREHARAGVEMGAQFIDLRPFWRAMDLATVIPDGLHPIVSAAIDAIVPELVFRISDEACSQAVR